MRNNFGLVAIALMLYSACAQEAARKSYTLHATVQQVKPLVLHNEPVEGFMDGMTMAWEVSDLDALARLKPGDRITAKVYDGDFTLYDVTVAPSTTLEKPPSATLGLEQLEQMALANNPTVAQVRANLRVASGLARQAGLYPNPTAGYYGDEIRGGYSNGGKQGGFVSQTIVLGGKLRAARRVAEFEANQIESSGEIQRMRILNNVRILFYQTLGAQRMVEVKQNLSKLAADTVQTSLQLGNIGQADRPDILQAEVEQQQANVGLRVAEQNLQSCWRVLAAVLGKPDLPPVALEGDLDAVPDLDYAEWLGAMLRESPEVKLAQQSVERAEALLDQARRAPIPDLQLTGLLVQNNEPLDTTRKPIGMQGGAQVGVELPIFNRNQGNIAAAKAGIESARQELNRVKLQLQRGLARVFQDYSSARLIAQQYKTCLLYTSDAADE